MKKQFLFLLLTIVFAACSQPSQTAIPNTISSVAAKENWQHQFDSILPLLGHRNWIIVVDKAFPAQSAAGMEVINTNDEMLPVLKYTLQRIAASTHVNPIVYRDREIKYITEKEAKGITALKVNIDALLGNKPVQSIVHDSVFTKMDAASKLFKILVLKTNAVSPYSSVYLQLDCKYWSANKEKELRESMFSGH